MGKEGLKATKLWIKQAKYGEGERSVATEAFTNLPAKKRTHQG